MQTRIHFNGAPDRTCGTLEDRLCDMMAVLPVTEIDVQIAQCGTGKTVPEIADEFRVEIADFGSSKICVEDATTSLRRRHSMTCRNG